MFIPVIIIWNRVLVCRCFGCIGTDGCNDFQRAAFHDVRQWMHSPKTPKCRPRIKKSLLQVLTKRPSNKRMLHVIYKIVTAMQGSKSTKGSRFYQVDQSLKYHHKPPQKMPNKKPKLSWTLEILLYPMMCVESLSLAKSRWHERQLTTRLVSKEEWDSAAASTRGPFCKIL